MSYEPDPMHQHYQHGCIAGLLRSVAKTLESKLGSLDFQCFIRDGIIEGKINHEHVAYIIVNTWMGSPQYAKALEIRNVDSCAMDVVDCQVRPWFDLHLDFPGYPPQKCDSYGKPMLLDKGSWRPYRQAKDRGDLKSFISSKSCITKNKLYSNGINGLIEVMTNRGLITFGGLSHG